MKDNKRLKNFVSRSKGLETPSETANILLKTAKSRYIYKLKFGL